MFEDYADGKRLYKEHTLQRTDPFGMWIILDAKGRHIKGVDSVFTNARDAGLALENYLVNIPAKKA